MYKYIVAILCFFASTSQVFAQNISSNKIAKVVVARAIVYSDESLNVPIGYLPNGKTLTVGKSRLMTKEIYPTIISGKLVYLDASEIEILDEDSNFSASKSNALKEHDIDIVLTKPEEKLNENNYFLFTVSRFDGGSQLSSTIYNLEDVNTSWFTSLNATVIHRNTFSKYYFGLGWELDILKANNASFNLFLLTPQIGYTLFKNNSYTFDLFFSLDLSTGTHNTVDNNTSSDPNGFIWGPQFGVKLFFERTKKMKYFTTLSYRNYKAYNYDVFYREDPSSVNDSTVTGFDGLGGINIGVGVILPL